jgi:hypothetical protein
MKLCADETEVDRLLMMACMTQNTRNITETAERKCSEAGAGNKLPIL